jgi:hypothetical protein
VALKNAFGIRWNIVGFAGGGAFVLSFLLGVFSGNPFLTILLRALLFGVIFALLGGGIALLFDRFIPQLTGAAEEAAAPGRKSDQPSNINIVLDEENPLKESELEELSLEDAEEGEGRTGRAVGSTRAADEAEPLEDGAVLEESGDDEYAAEPAASGSKTAFGRAAGEAGNGELATSATVPRTPAAGGDVSTAEEKSLAEGDLDVLPDMSSFESSFSPVTSGGMVSDTDSFESFGTDSLKKGDLDKDPDTYVKAVRTIMKRDEGKNK